ncbi:hypothetical protein E5F05_00730 (plasmid) [Deinococcus metallilatus]|nr:hypothetical protein E5F05_00730 [Deinococcus metallilatus]RXJ18150.1 hypothetical protein ERJ73_00340 [Deinococcus metallilatus]TLK32356.1 hypothetical protein FCS05_01360 [Deinococcus metallilatus]
MKRRMNAEGHLPVDSESEAAPVREADTPVLPEITKAPEEDPLESFNTRLPRSLQRRLKIHVALEGKKIQDVLSIALDEYLKKHNH